jgi:hypothetical protein
LTRVITDAVVEGLKKRSEIATANKPAAVEAIAQEILDAAAPVAEAAPVEAVVEAPAAVAVEETVVAETAPQA